MDVNCATTRRKTSSVQQHDKLCPKEEKNASLKKVSLILQKSENDRTLEDQQILTEYAEVVEDLKMRWHRRDEAKRRLEEIEEPLDVIEHKCRLLVEAIVKSEHLVVYTGAGISTAACIPDYRGSNGIWTRLQQGKDIGNHDLSLAEPTVTHMALAELYHKKILKYVVSQNCDGLHLRSGLPRTALSELHGNMYIEVCKTCKPAREYWRIFDVTENTARYSHKTMRRCYACSGELTDTIVHFGERGTLQWPLNWPGACKNADAADTIICLGSSLKVLKKYPHLWQMNKPAKKRPNLYIVNLQWTPKDDCANLKINGKCDDVMKILMKYLGLEIPPYRRESDPIFHHASELNRQEAHTTNQPCLLKAPAQSTNPLEAPAQSIKAPAQSFKGPAHLTNPLEVPAQSLKAPAQLIKPPAQLIKAPAQSLKAPAHSTNPLKAPAQSLKAPAHATNPLKAPAQSNFSIDNILSGANDPSASALMAAYYLNLQNIFLPNLTGLYPFQTSLLYSGLHSIINPIPVINYDFKQESAAVAAVNYAASYTTANCAISGAISDAITCDYCVKNYQTFCCQFYARNEAVFQKKLHRFSKKDQTQKELICVCCDYTTDEEGEESGDSDGETKKAKMEIVAENEAVIPAENAKIAAVIPAENAKENETKMKIQPGWFGKGYKKNRKAGRKKPNTARIS